MNFLIISLLILLFIPIIFSFFIYHPQTCTSYQNFQQIKIEQLNKDIQNIPSREQFLNSDIDQDFNKYLDTTESNISLSEPKTIFILNGLRKIVFKLNGEFLFTFTSLSGKICFIIEIKKGLNDDYEIYINRKLLAKQSKTFVFTLILDAAKKMWFFGTERCFPLPFSLDNWPVFVNVLKVSAKELSYLTFSNI